jgi:molybdate transport system regulatory protein
MCRFLHIEKQDSMKRPKPSRFEILLNYKLWLSSITGEGIIEEDRYRLLKQIKESGSLSSAAKNLGISYRKAWGDIKKAEELLGYGLTDRQRGGKDGGRTRLTEKANKLLEAYEALHLKMDDAVEEAYNEFKRKIK